MDFKEISCEYVDGFIYSGKTSGDVLWTANETSGSINELGIS
jgi:hypothetical protein